MPSGEPQFATVSVLLGDEVVGTFRVPITDETTVRRLAKDTMHRFLTCRGQRHQLHMREAISVTEMFVNSGSNRAEIFAQDIVTHVVLVKEEVLYMRLRLKETALVGGISASVPVAATTTATTDAGIVAVTANAALNKRNETGERVMDSRSDAMPPTVAPSATSATATAASSSIETKKSANWTPVSVANTGCEEEGMQQVGNDSGHSKQNPVGAAGSRKSTSKRRTATATASKRRLEKEAEREDVEEEEEEKERGVSALTNGRKRRATERGLGWGPEAHKNFAENYVSSPNKLMQKPRTSRKRATASRVTPQLQLRDVSPARESSPMLMAEEDLQPKSRPGWGPEAAKYFPDNYVTSPDRIARLNRRAKRQALKLEEEAKEKAQQQARQLGEVDEEEDERGASAITTTEPHCDLISRCSGTVLPHEETEEPQTAPAAVAPTITTTPETTQHDTGHPEQGSKSGRSSENTEGMSASFPIMVERQLNYEVFDDVAAACTPTSQSTRSLFNAQADSEKVQEPLPPGWGKEAARFFDVETYFDNPNRAKLSPDVLSRPVRARRDVVLPFYFSSLDQ